MSEAADQRLHKLKEAFEAKASYWERAAFYGEGKYDFPFNKGREKQAKECAKELRALMRRVDGQP